MAKFNFAYCFRCQIVNSRSHFVGKTAILDTQSIKVTFPHTLDLDFSY